MDHIIVNGSKKSLALAPENHFQDLYEELKRNYNHESSLISSIRVDGMEINSEMMEDLADIPLSDLESIEISTHHPRELAEDTLQTLIQFTENLEVLSLQAAEDAAEGQFGEEFARLMEGIQIFTDALNGVKALLKIRKLDTINILEADLLVLLSDLLKCKESGRNEYVSKLLEQNLPELLMKMREKGLPALIRSRDC